MPERNAAAVTALARAAALSLYAGQEGQINLHKLLDAAVDSTCAPPPTLPAPPLRLRRWAPCWPTCARRGSTPP